MPYTQEISRARKACILFLVDQSSSMEESLAGSDNRKCDEAARSINAWLQNLLIRCSGANGARDWIDIGVLGYRTDGDGNAIVESALQGPLAGQRLVSIVDVGNHPGEILDVTSRCLDEETWELVEFTMRTPVWIAPRAEGAAPMCNALYRAYEVLEPWIATNQLSLPPMVIDFTGGRSDDGDPVPYAEALTSLATDDGNVLLFHCYLSSVAADPFIYPSSEVLLPDDPSQAIFRMSSVLPAMLSDRAIAEGFDVQPNARGMAFNTDLVSLIRFIDMGTRVARERR